MKKLLNIFSTVILVVIGGALLSSCKKTSLDIPANLNGAADTTAGPDSSLIGLVAWYPFNSSGFDYSGNGNPAASVHDITSVTDRASVPDGAYAFNGITSYIKATTTPTMCLNNTDFTINVWVKPDSYGGTNGSVIMGKRGVGPKNGWVLSVTNSSNNSRVKAGLVSFIPGSTDQYAIDTNAISLNSWCMITVMYNNSAKRCSIYIDGKLDTVTENIISPAADTLADVFVGRDNLSNTSESYFFKGIIDDIRVYNRLITNNELKKLKTRPD